jgi:hypothetical protein
MPEEHFTREELRWLDKNENNALICPFCKQKTFKHTGQISMGMDDESDEYGCANCGFEGLDDNLLILGTKIKQAERYREQLQDEIKECKAKIIIAESKLLRCKI